jgi:hypothetical protein
VLAAVRSDRRRAARGASPVGGGWGALAGRVQLGVASPPTALASIAALAVAAWLAATLLAPLGRHSFAGTVLAGRPGATATLREQSGQSELTVAGLHAPPPGRTYEVWLAGTRGAPRATDALFAPSRSGTASVAVPGSLRGVREVLVTSEPLGGAAMPTAPPALRVRLPGGG